MSEPFDLDTPDHFTAGAMGPPGQRTFFLQAREHATLVTLKCEKEHVRALADYLAGLLERMSITAEPEGRDAGLLEPLQPAWDVGAIGVGYDDAGRRIVIEIHEAVQEEEDDDDEDEADEADEAEDDADDGDEEESPRQQTFALDVPEAPGAFGRAAERAGDAGARNGRPETLLSGDWAAAVPKELAARPATDRPPAPAPPPVEREAVEPESHREAVAATTGTGSEAEVVPERTGLPPSLGLRMKPAPEPPVVEPVTPVPAPPAAPPPSIVVPERAAESPARPRESRHRLDIAVDSEFNGELLRRVRESYGLSLQQVAERTRITRIHLENVEADRYDKLPATVYLRGILVNLARELRLDPARVSKTYLLAAQRAHARGS